MQVKLIIIGVVFVLLMVMFGNNPIEEKRLEYEKKKQGLDDPLIEAINEYHKKKPLGTVGGSRFSVDGIDENGRKIPDHRNTPDASRVITPSDALPQLPDQNPGIQQDRNPNKSYYPPPPLRDDSLLLPGQGMPKVPHDQAHLYLRSGQPLAYRGTHVYYTTESGEMKPLPDGRYQMENGLELFIQGGRKYVASN